MPPTSLPEKREEDATVNGYPASLIPSDRVNPSDSGQPAKSDRLGTGIGDRVRPE
jgi:hypothetical protein